MNALTKMQNAPLSPQTQKLVLAISRRDMAAAQDSIAQGADCCFRDIDGRSGLHLAALQGDLEMIRLLVSHGADVLARDNAGKTARETALPPSGGSRLADDAFNRFLGLPTEESLKRDYQILIDYLAKAETAARERLAEQSRLNDEAVRQGQKNLKNKAKPGKFRL